jgi:glutamate 5-kinase
MKRPSTSGADVIEQADVLDPKPATMTAKISSKVPSLADFRRIVVKVGSSLIVDAGASRVHEDWLASLVDDIAWLHGGKRDVLVVSSGAIALGRAVLKLPKGPLKLEDSQAAAAVGQIALARTWSEALGRFGISAGQIQIGRAHV